MKYLKSLVHAFSYLLVSLLMTITILIALGYLLSYRKANQAVGKINVSVANKIQLNPSPTATLSESIEIENALKSIIASYPQLNWGISFIDITNADKASINGTEVFHGASTTKILIACLLLNQIEQGKYSLDTNLNGATLKQLTWQMVNRSDNDAWEEIMNFIGFNYQAPFAKSLGIYSYDVANNNIDPNDMALLLYKLYGGQILNSSDTALLLSYMQNTNNEELIPPAAPQDALVYHKYGSFGKELDDAAIIDDKKRPFVLVIYTSTASGELTYAQRANVFHQIVKSVYNVIEPQ